MRNEGLPLETSKAILSVTDLVCCISFHLMGSLFGNWPSYDPHNFSQLRPFDPTTPSKMTPTAYHATHNRTLPPPDQVITTESKNILLRHMYQQHAEEKLRQKRAASENLLPEHGSKQLKGSVSDKS